MIPTQHQLAKRYSFCEGKLYVNVQNIEFPYNSLEPFQQQSSAVSGLYHCSESEHVEHVEVKSIGDEALFIGDNESISFCPSNYPADTTQMIPPLLEKMHP
ncbi:hypothetical protein Pyn_01013 [Prunus yedoensis var. nudiflora]|uniref:Uncharacterized protein n=1 Tax=Prunus yedoensis var. nudiflora TaxID=2094558 RepID=A0A314UP76_PRUYE|nr:hypothetical protein Pyn_01013 [Prunus yedoensis var. nudiflora]